MADSEIVRSMTKKKKIKWTMMVNRLFVVGKQRSSSKEGFFDGDRFGVVEGREKEVGFFSLPRRKKEGKSGFFFLLGRRLAGSLADASRKKMVLAGSGGVLYHADIESSTTSIWHARACIVISPRKDVRQESIVMQAIVFLHVSFCVFSLSLPGVSQLAMECCSHIAISQG